MMGCCVAGHQAGQDVVEWRKVAVRHGGGKSWGGMSARGKSEG